MRDYKSKGIHHKLAEQLIDDFKLEEKSTLFWVIRYVGSDGKAVGGVEGSKIFNSGRDYFWERRVETWLKPLMNVAFPQQTSLEDHFNDWDIKLIPQKKRKSKKKKESDDMQQSLGDFF